MTPQIPKSVTVNAIKRESIPNARNFWDLLQPVCSAQLLFQVELKTFKNGVR